MSVQKPSFDSLPLRPDGPRGNAWGLFGADDQMGMLNLLTPQNTAVAAQEIKEGVRVSTDWALNSMATPCFGRSAFEHTVKNKASQRRRVDIQYPEQLPMGWLPPLRLQGRVLLQWTLSRGYPDIHSKWHSR